MSRLDRILIIRFSSLGDVIITTSLISELRCKFKNSTIDVLTKESYREIFINNTSVDNIITLKDDAGLKELNELKKKLEENCYDVIIDLHKNLRTFYLKMFVKSKWLTYRKLTIKKYLLAKFKINLLKDTPPAAERYKEVLSKLYLTYDRKSKPIMHYSEKDKEYIEQLLENKKADTDKKILILVPSSKHFTKTYPAEKWIEFIKLTDENKFELIMTGTDNDKDFIEKIMNGTDKKPVNLCSELTLGQLAALMDRAYAVVSGDTGPMHIAEALDKKLICIAGPSVRELGFFPVNENAIVIENKGLYCRPCSTIGKSYCPEKHFRCMKEIGAESIVKLL